MRSHEEWNASRDERLPCVKSLVARREVDGGVVHERDKSATVTVRRENTSLKKRDMVSRRDLHWVHRPTGLGTNFVLSQTLMRFFGETADPLTSLCWLFAQVTCRAAFGILQHRYFVVVASALISQETHRLSRKLWK
jgi:hypothetical protein